MPVPVLAAVAAVIVTGDDAPADEVVDGCFIPSTDSSASVCGNCDFSKA